MLPSLFVLFCSSDLMGLDATLKCETSAGLWIFGLGLGFGSRILAIFKLPTTLYTCILERMCKRIFEIFYFSKCFRNLEELLLFPHSPNELCYALM